MNIDLKDLQKHKLIPANSKLRGDICISHSSSRSKTEAINIRLNNPVFGFYKFIGFIPYNGKLYIELSNKNDGTYYTISQKNELTTQTDVTQKCAVKTKTSLQILSVNIISQLCLNRWKMEKCFVILAKKYDK